MYELFTKILESRLDLGFWKIAKRLQKARIIGVVLIPDGESSIADSYDDPEISKVAKFWKLHLNTIWQAYFFTDDLIVGYE